MGLSLSERNKKRLSILIYMKIGIPTHLTPTYPLLYSRFKTGFSWKLWDLKDVLSANASDSEVR